MAATVFIDGEVGTTGLQIHARLKDRDDLQLVHLEESERKDAKRRREVLNDVDLAILCLPDDAAREAVSLIGNSKTRVIDASTAYRVDPDWVYGMPEYDAKHSERIASATRVSNPGCYAIAAIGLLHPLVQEGLIPSDWPVTINAVSGYTGGGKSLIAAFEDPTDPDYTDEPFSVYGLGLEHKHVPEIHKHSGLDNRPLFMPSIAKFRQGMIVQIPLQLNALPKHPAPGDLHAALSSHYAGRRFVTVASEAGAAAIVRLDPEGLNGTNELRLHVFGNEANGQVVLMGLLDNLGKGASGCAVQNMNLMLGLPEESGLET
ncbi:MAG: N-acetyl-gamma-glutamyl-phosphate reductase [Rhodospirillaceae bacterium]|jgi:N-acetyl-gamma-glutamyl-phosphate reductase|nr:N-acetyl-gamma-glutamyl-phosphate reductase [Rhodospirillaceae bacterium]